MCDIADARSKKAEDGASSGAQTAPRWRQIEDGLWSLSPRPGLLRVIERRSEGEYLVLSGHRSQIGRFATLSVAMTAAVAAEPAAVA